MINQRNKQTNKTCSLLIYLSMCKFRTYRYDALKKEASFPPGKCIKVSSILPNTPINF